MKFLILTNIVQVPKGQSLMSKVIDLTEEGSEHGKDKDTKETNAASSSKGSKPQPKNSKSRKNASKVADNKAGGKSSKYFKNKGKQDNE